MRVLSLLYVVILSILIANSNGLDERQLEVSELPTAKFVPPNCVYSVRKNDQFGSEVKGSVSVGDPLFHSWKCSSTGSLYCIMVHSCSISHNVGRKAKRVEIIDEFGCSIFPELVPNMRYFNDTEAGFQANAFLIDIEQMSLFFQCSLKFLVKTDGFCRRPLCARKN